MRSLQEELDVWISGLGLVDAPRVIAVPVCARTPEQAFGIMRSIPYGNEDCIFVVEDRWRRDAEAVKARVLSHLRAFTQVYARNCELRRIDKPTAAFFLQKAHSYGDAACRFRYGLFLKRLTGEKTSLPQLSPSSSALQTAALLPGTLVAVAEFSSPRRWRKGDSVISSYEWVRYASLPGIRVEGGMGKLLKAFIRDRHPDDIMTYADLEWSGGAAYRQLGFVEESRRPPVLFWVDPSEWRRRHVSPVFPSLSSSEPVRSTLEPLVFTDGQSGQLCSSETCSLLYHASPGSIKYRLALHDVASGEQSCPMNSSI